MTGTERPPAVEARAPRGTFRMRLDRDRLLVAPEGGETRAIAYDTIREVRLRTYGTLFRCVVRPASGAPVVFQNVWGALQFRNDDYRALVEALHERLEPFAERIRFRSGNPVYYAMTVVFVALVAVGLPLGALYALFIRGRSPGDMPLFRMLVFYVFVVFGMGGLAFAFRPRVYTPDAIPAAALPKSDP